MSIYLEEYFEDRRLMVILRGYSPDRTVALAEKAWDAGIDVLEVPIGRPDQTDSLRAAVDAGRERGQYVGAGTVISVDHVKAAVDAGAVYTVAPGCDPEVIDASTAAGLPHLPGVATASEIQLARKHGCQWVKAFPASTLGTAWFGAMRGPFHDMRFVATGGVTVDNARAFFDEGVSIVALGSALADEHQVARLSELVSESRFA